MDDSLCFLMRASSPFCRMSPFLRIPLFHLNQFAWRHLRRFFWDKGYPECHPSSILCHVVSEQSAVHFVKSLLFSSWHHSYFVVFCKATLKQPHDLLSSNIIAAIMTYHNVIAMTSSLFKRINYTSMVTLPDTLHARLWHKGCAFSVYSAHLQLQHTLYARIGCTCRVVGKYKFSDLLRYVHTKIFHMQIFSGSESRLWVEIPHINIYNCSLNLWSFKKSKT